MPTAKRKTRLEDEIAMVGGVWRGCVRRGELSRHGSQCNTVVSNKSVKGVRRRMSRMAQGRGLSLDDQECGLTGEGRASPPCWAEVGLRCKRTRDAEVRLMS